MAKRARKPTPSSSVDPHRRSKSVSPYRAPFRLSSITIARIRRWRQVRSLLGSAAVPTETLLAPLIARGLANDERRARSLGIDLSAIEADSAPRAHPVSDRKRRPAVD